LSAILLSDFVDFIERSNVAVHWENTISYD
jgi:hypothetical protein